MEKISQFDPRGKDVFQLRDHLYDYAKKALISGGLEREYLENQLSKIMGFVDRTLLIPDQRARAQAASNAQDIFNYLVKMRAGAGDPLAQKAPEVMGGFASQLKQIYDLAPEMLPHLGDLRSTPAEEDPLKDLVPISWHLSQFADQYERVEPGMRPVGDGQYEFFVNTEAGEIPLVSLRIDDPEGALRNLQEMAQRLKGIDKKSPEGSSEWIRMMASTPFETPETQHELGRHQSARFESKLRAAYNSLYIALGRLRAYQEAIREAAEPLQAQTSGINLGSLMMIFSDLISELGESLASIQQAMKGKATLDLTQFESRSAKWTGRFKVAQHQLPREAYRLRDVVREAIRFLEGLKGEIQEKTLKVESSSWRVVTAVGGLAPGAQEAPVQVQPQAPEPPVQVQRPEPEPASEPAAPQRPSGDPMERLYKWEISLAVGAVNRGIKALNDILADTDFWMQFVRTYGDWTDQTKPWTPPEAQTLDPGQVGEIYQ